MGSIQTTMTKIMGKNFVSDGGCMIRSFIILYEKEKYPEVITL